ncbi:MAG: ribbon-helix-helix domain-containing protein [Chloroflexota bacterium]
MPPKPARKSLTDALQASSGNAESKKLSQPEGVKPTEKRATPSKVPSRQGKKFIGGHFAPEVSIQLKVLAAKQERSQEQLIAEALNLLFVHYGENPIA